MIYSVWNSGARQYDYYQTSQPSPVHAGAPRHVAKSSPLGATVDDALYPLPPGATRIGSGPIAKGKVARASGTALGDLGVADVPKYLKVAIGIAVVLVVGKHLR